VKNSIKSKKCARLVDHASLFVCVLNKNGYSRSFYINDSYFRTFYFVLKWAKARKLPRSIFIMPCFKTVVGPPGPVEAFTLFDQSRASTVYFI
jgi:hypothetical protein